MRIALPVSEGKLCPHFGHCEKFEMFDVDDQTKMIIGKAQFSAPPHEPGLLPRWLADKGVKCVIAGGMGSRALKIFRENGVMVITGSPSGDPGEIVKEYLEGRLALGANVCDH